MSLGPRRFGVWLAAIKVISVLLPGRRGEDHNGLPLYTDLYDPESKLVIEAKGTVTREAIRMAVGQLLDYSRFLDRPKLAVLLPERPRRDLLEFLHSHSIAVIAQHSDGQFGVTASDEAEKKTT